MNDDDLLRQLHELGADLEAAPASELRRVRAGIVRRRRMRVGATAGVAVAAVAVVAAVVLPGTTNRSDVTPTVPTVSVSTPPTTPPVAPSTSTPATPATSAPASTPGTVVSSSSTAPATTLPDTFAEIGHGNVVVLRSAATGALVRTLVGAGDGDLANAGGHFAAVGPSGRYVYYAAVGGAARVPIGGGTPQLIATAPSGSVEDVYADPTDTRVEITTGAGESTPQRAYEIGIGSHQVVALGTGIAAGWDRDGGHAYVESLSGRSITMTAVEVADPTQHAYAETFTSPAGPAPCTSVPIGAADAGHVAYLLGGCGSNPALHASYRVVFPDGASDRTSSLVEADFPAADRALVVDRATYTPAGDLVVGLRCGSGPTGDEDAYAVLHGNGDAFVDLPLGSRTCS